MSRISALKLAKAQADAANGRAVTMTRQLWLTPFYREVTDVDGSIAWSFGLASVKVASGAGDEVGSLYVHVLGSDAPVVTGYWDTEFKFGAAFKEVENDQDDFTGLLRKRAVAATGDRKLKCDDGHWKRVNNKGLLHCQECAEAKRDAGRKPSTRRSHPVTVTPVVSDEAKRIAEIAAAVEELLAEGIALNEARDAVREDYELAEDYFEAA